MGRLSLLALAMACSSSTAPEAVGAWGGRDASLTLSAAGGEVTYLCGVGTIDAGWSLSPDGAFAGTGEHYAGGGPVPSEGRPATPARYAGQVDGSVFTLTVTLTDLGQTLGPYRLVRGGPAVQEICL